MSLIDQRGNPKELYQTLLRDMLQAMMQVLMNAERAAFLADEHSQGEANHANGFYQRGLETVFGKIPELKVPRDRHTRFKPALLEPYQRRMSGVDEMIVGLYSRGMSDRDIQAVLRETYGAEISPTTISAVTQGAQEERQRWQSRPLKPRWVALYVDALVVKLRRHTVENEAVYLVIGVDEQGYREVLGLYLGGNESSSVWEEYFHDLRQRGVHEVLVGVMDGLAGIEEAFHRVFPRADCQRCFVHQERRTLLKARHQDKTEIAADLKRIRQSESFEEGTGRLKEFAEKWRWTYPSLMASWRDNAESLLTFLHYPGSIRQYLYTTNWIERLNKELRKVVKTKNSFPTEDSVLNLLYLKIMTLTSRFGERRVLGFDEAYHELQERFKSRYEAFTQDS